MTLLRGLAHQVKWANWNDQLSLLLIVGVPGLWIASNWITLPPEAIGATILAWGNTVQYYVRRAPPSSGST